MDWNLAIERNREALRRILASLVAMAGLAGGDPVLPGRGGRPATLPRHLYRAVLALLRPAESAARRLIIVMARGLVVTLKPPRPPRPKPKTSFATKGGTGIVLPRGFRRGPPRPPPLAISLPLLDPPRHLPSWAGGRVRRKYVPAHLAPRIWAPGFERSPLPPPPSPHDPIDATRLGLRLSALGSALDDLPAQAKRFARWQARRDAGRVRRMRPLRPGRPPGGRLSRYDPDAPRRRNVREVDEILAHAHALAVYALESPDTS